MNWQFDFIDRNNIVTQVDEPVGWDSCVIKLSRDKEKHGLMTDFQTNDFQFNGAAARILKSEYEQFGVKSFMVLVISLSCNDQDPEELYRGQLIFSSYSYVSSDECYVGIGMETTGDVVKFINRIEQKVNLLTDRAFDQVTSLAPYANLPLTIELPSKGILIKNKSENTKIAIEEFVGAVTIDGSETDTIRIGESGMIELANDKIIAGEIGGFGMQTSPEYKTIKSGYGGGTGYNLPPFDGGDDVYSLPLPSGSTQLIHLWPRATQSIVNWTDGMPGFNGEAIDVDTHIRVKGRLDPLNIFTMSSLAFVIVRLNKTAPPDYLKIDYLFQIYGGNSGTVIPDEGFAFDIAYDNAALTLQPDDEIFSFITVIHSKTLAQQFLPAFMITYDPECYWRMERLSIGQPSLSKIFMINEAFSRITEAITDDRIRAYSEYFGRTDSLPYSLPQDGPGSLKGLSSGLFIRRVELSRPDTPPVFALSIKDMWDGLNPIHNLGMGIEPDTNRSGFSRLRIEPWQWFYKNVIVHRCDFVKKIERKMNSNLVYSSFSIGYSKWEAEAYNGLDEFLTKRTFRTDLNEIKNELTKLSNMIASGYALEVTRRLGSDSKDWRYDNETFIICLKRDGDANIVVELGNITSPENIIDPDTIYNFRISPARMALRWMDVINQSYRSGAGDLIFTAGEGNFYANGKMANAVDRLEANPIQENETISNIKFANPAQAIPKIWPESINFEHDLSLKDFKTIKANPYGLIEFSNECESGSGWIENIEYTPEEGKATFLLIPKFS